MEKNTITHNSLRSYGNLSSSSPAFTAGAYLKGTNGIMTKNEISFNEVWDYSNEGSYAIGAIVVNSPDSFIIDGNSIRESAVKQGTGICYGGVMEVYGTGIISVINNIIEGNIATYGGGMRIDNTSTVKIVNNTIINNKSTYGGGISVNNATGYVMKTIVWGNQAPTHAGVHVESGNIHVAHCDVQDWTGEGNINEYPRLDADTLLNDSPCIGKGISSFDFGGGMVCLCPATDINGRLRPYPPGSNPDMGAWESLLDTALVGIDLMPIATVPQEYSLSQNYPNPFNPSTTIEFTLPKSAFVTLKVYNLLGEEVATLVSKNLSAGKYKYLWDASYTGGMASGVYLYRLHAGEFEKTKKLILMK